MKKNILAKFNNINFPIFTLKCKPYKILYDLHKITCIMKPEGHIQTIDDKRLSGDYFSRLLQLDARVSFDYTCRNVQDLIFTKVAWGIDSKAIPHDFSQLSAATIEKRQVTKVVGNLFWLRNISYPFEIPTQENIRLEDSVYATMVFVNGEWFLKEFSYDSKLERPYIYV
jgi:hypothetical protein